MASNAYGAKLAIFLGMITLGHVGLLATSFRVAKDNNQIKVFFQKSRDATPGAKPMEEEVPHMTIEKLFFDYYDHDIFPDSPKPDQAPELVNQWRKYYCIKTLAVSGLFMAAMKRYPQIAESGRYSFLAGAALIGLATYSSMCFSDLFRFGEFSTVYLKELIDDGALVVFRRKVFIGENKYRAGEPVGFMTCDEARKQFESIDAARSCQHATILSSIVLGATGLFLPINAMFR